MTSIGDLLQLEVVYNTPWGVCENTFGFVALTNQADGLTNLAQAFKTPVVSNGVGGILNVRNQGVKSSLMRVSDVKPGTAARLDYSYTEVAGNGGGDPLPPQCAGVISWRTALSGRSYKGRTYLFGFEESAQTNGLWNTDGLNLITATRDTLLQYFGPTGSNSDFRLCVISRYANKVKRATPIGTNILSGAVRNIVYTQRRRVTGVGS